MKTVCPEFNSSDAREMHLPVCPSPSPHTKIRKIIRLSELVWYSGISIYVTYIHIQTCHIENRDNYRTCRLTIYLQLETYVHIEENLQNGILDSIGVIKCSGNRIAQCKK